MNTQDRIALVIGRLVIEREVSAQQLEELAVELTSLKTSEEKE